MLRMGCRGDRSPLAGYTRVDARYWYMTPAVVAESDLSGNLKSEYVFFDGERVARKDFPGAGVSYYFSDHLGTASVITNATGTITEDEDFTLGAARFSLSTATRIITSSPARNETQKLGWIILGFGTTATGWEGS
jgi:hypothetical protein